MKKMMRQLSRCFSSALGAICLFYCTTSPLAALPVPEGLVGWWKGESNVVDIAGGANGYITNGASYAPAEVGIGFSLDGVSNRVVVPNASSLNFGTNQNFSIEVWIQAQPTPYNYLGYTVIADKADEPSTASSLGWKLFLQYGRLGFLMSQAPRTTSNMSIWSSSSANLQDGRFHHVAVTVDRTSSTGGKMYVDGNVVCTFDPTPENGDLSNTVPLYIGNHNNPDLACTFKGLIDELSVYNRRLTAAEIRAIYQAAGAGKSIEPSAPSIVAQPASLQVVQGNNVTIDVGVVGTQPFAYQWNFNGTNIAGATNSSLTLANFQSASAGAYAVAISNSLGLITSSNAILTLKTSAPAPIGMVGWWRGESNVFDAVSLASGYETNGAAYAPGKVGAGFSLDGVNDRVIVPNSQSLNFGTNQNFSVEAWIQAQPTPANYNGITVIVDKANTPDVASTLGWVFYLQSGRLAFLMAQAPMTSANYTAWVSPSPNLQDGKFHHVAVTVDRTSTIGGKLYVDGSVVCTFNPTLRSGDLSTDGPLYIGSHDNPGIRSYFKGIIDEVAIYDRSLTTNEITAICQAADAGKVVQPIAPFIIAQPVSQRVEQGNSVTIGVGIVGTPTIAFQWNFNEINIDGATNSSFTLTNFQAANAGAYAAVITNAIGSVTSSNALLTLITPQTAPQGLVGWWRGESNVLDAVNLTSGYTTNGADFAPARVGTGFSFDGVNDRVIIPDAWAMNFGSNQNFSVEAWILAQPVSGNSYATADIVVKATTPDSSRSIGWALYLQSGRLCFQMSKAPMLAGGSLQWASSSPNLLDGKLHHVAATLNRSSTTGGKLYADGILVRTFDPTSENGDLSTDGPLFIGGSDNPDLNVYFKGLIDELSVYNRELNPAEIGAVYQAAGAGKAVQEFAPVIAAQPASQRVLQNNNATMAALFAGTPPFAFQWTFNGANIAQATNSTLTLKNFQPSDTGAYAVLIRNAAGSITSSNALLTLLTPETAPLGLVGWWRGESNVLDMVSLTSGYATNGADYGPGQVGFGFSFDGVSNRVMIPNAPALNFGSNQNFSVETWIQAQPTPGNYSGYSVIADKAYEPDGSSSLGWKLVLQNGQLSFLMAQAPRAYGNYSIWSTSSLNLQDGKFHHVAATVNRASNIGGKLYVDGNVILTFDPTIQSGDLSNDAPLRLGCHNNPDFNCFFKGIIDEFSLYNRELSSVEILAIYQAASAGKAVQEFAPIIIAQPTGQRVAQGGNASIQVSVTGTPPWTFQWSFNGTNIAGATNNPLGISNVQLTDAGAYAVVVSNTAGSVKSSNAALIVVLPQLAPQGMIGWWKGESNAFDVISGLNGYLTNGAGYGPGEVGTGFNFDGVDDRVVIPNAPLLNFGADQDFSIEAWIQAQPTPQNYYGFTIIADKAYAPDAYSSVGWVLFMQNGNLGFLLSQSPMSSGNSSACTSSGPNLQDGQFHHVAATVDRTSNTGGKLYVDGSLVLTFDPTWEAGDLSNSAPLRIGNHNNPELACNFKGIIDEVSLYNRELTSTEIGAIYQAASAGKVVAPSAPFIVSQPVSQAIAQGNSLIIEVGVGGSKPFSYQWTFNGSNIAGATNNPLILSNVHLADAGAYSVVITNATGSITSSNAILTVVLPITAPNGLVGWWRGESNAVDEFSGSIGYETNGAGFATGKVGTGFSFDGTNSSVVIPNSPNLNFGANQNFSVEGWIQTQPFAQPSYPYYGSYVQRASIAEKSSNPADFSHTVGWKFFIDNTVLVFMMSQSSAGNDFPGYWATTNAVITDSNFHHVAATVDRTSKTGGKLYVDGQVVLTFDPTPQNGDLSSTSPLSIGTKIDPPVLVGPTASANYFKGVIDEVTVYNRALSSNEIVAIGQVGVGGKILEPSAPIIARQPSSQRVVQGNNVMLEVGAGGTQPLAFQWLFNGANVAGGTNSWLTLTNVKFAQAGTYSVKVSNGLGSVTSSNALLRVDYPPATVLVANVTGSASAPITVPVLLLANGNENAVSFSVNFDPTVLAFANVSVGAGASGGSLFTNTNLVGSGKLGVILALPSGSVFSAGTREVVNVSFNVTTTQAGSTPVTLGNQPTLSQLSDVAAIILAANYESGMVNIAAADFEGDVTPRPNGDKAVTLTDWVQEGRYVARLDNPVGASEYQRADCAPQSTRGDGAITVLDWVQAGRYAVGLDPLVPVGGPTSEMAPIEPLDNHSSRITESTSGCEVRIVEMSLAQGQSGTVSVVMEAQGTENAAGFSLAFDPATIRFLNASRGSAAAVAMFNVNTNDVASGRVGFALALSPGQTFGTGTKEILKLSVQVAASAATGPSLFTFTDVPVTKVVSDTTAIAVDATFTQGVVDVSSSIPALRISRLSDQVVLAWPDWATNYVLQVSGNAGTNLNWTNSAASSTLTNSQCAVTLPASANAEFYRLIQSGMQKILITPASTGSTNTTVIKK
jgi:hypothetical protein